MKKVIILLVIFISKLSCVSNKNEDSINSELYKKAEINKNEILKHEEFEIYWEEFHFYILKNKFDLLEELVFFPIVVNGYEDLDPIHYIKRDSFEITFNKFLTAPLLFYNEDFISHKKFIEITPDVKFLDEYKEYKKTDNWIRIQNMVFERNNKVWKLKEIYMDTKNWNSTPK